MISIFDSLIKPSHSGIFVADSLLSDENVPEFSLAAAPRVWFNDSCVCVGTLMVADGPTRLEVYREEVTTLLSKVYAGTIFTPSNRITITDSFLTEFCNFAVEQGRTRLEIYTNDFDEPDHVIISVQKLV